MKIGYPCINTAIGCRANKTFRLASYSKELLVKTVQNNLDCLKKILLFNVQHNLLFFRIASNFVPFASHPVCKFNWKEFFKTQLQEIGIFIKKHKIRISMHPDQFVLINSQDRKIVTRSVRELEYHAAILDLMELDATAKIQMHIGGLYGDKRRSIARFIQEYKKLNKTIQRRLVIEHDERSYSLKDCLEISHTINIPVVFDTLHHNLFNNGENYRNAIALCTHTWSKRDGIPIVDYSDQDKTKKKGAHSNSINIKNFKVFLRETRDFDFDIMLEIKDKQKSALKAVKLIS